MMDVFYINRNSDLERKLQMNRTLQHKSWIRNTVRVTAVEGCDVRVDKNGVTHEDDRFFFDTSTTRLLKPNEAACTLSHIKALREIMKTNTTEWVLVLEDDVVFDDNFSIDISSIPTDCAILQLYCNNVQQIQGLYKTYRETRSLFTKKTSMKMILSMWSTAAYLVKKDFIEKTLLKRKRVRCSIYFLADVYLYNNAMSYAYNKPLLRTNDLYLGSTIQGGSLRNHHNANFYIEYLMQDHGRKEITVTKISSLSDWVSRRDVNNDSRIHVCVYLSSDASLLKKIYESNEFSLIYISISDDNHATSTAYSLALSHESCARA